ncbi:MAG TPA: TRAP transporter small permease [Gammaproteobacteria bacterium]|nr:TRAP transporter small permease [Gammaproteobacteria bacterium]
MDDGSQTSWLTRAARIGLALENAVLVALLGFLIVFSFVQIVLRNVFSIGVTWGDGLTRVVVLWLALLGALAASRDGRHIRMNALAQWLPPRLHVAVGVGSDLFAAVVSAALAYFAFEFVSESRSYGDQLLGEFPAWWFESIMPVAFALIAYRFVIHALGRKRGT